MCGGSLGVSKISVEKNNKPDIEPADHVAIVRLRITDDHSIVVVKKFIELELA